MTNEQKMHRLYDRLDGIVSKQVGINYAIKKLMRVDKELLKQYAKVCKEIDALREWLKRPHSEVGK